METDQYSLNYGSSIFRLFLGPIPQMLRKKITTLISTRQQSFSDILNDNKHTLYHLMERRRCCQCKEKIYKNQTTSTAVGKQIFEILFKCDSEKRIKSHCYMKGIVCLCQFVPKEDCISESTRVLKSLDFWALSFLLLNVVTLEEEETKCVEILRDYRNQFIGHPKTELDLSTFEVVWTHIKEITLTMLENIGVYDEALEYEFDKQHPDNWKLKKAVASSGPFEIKEEHFRAINELSHSLDEDNFVEFKHLLTAYMKEGNKDSDLENHCYYLEAHNYLHTANYDDAKVSIQRGLQRAENASNPKYFRMQMLTVKARMCVNMNNMDELEDTMRDLDNIIESDKILFHGKVAGWFFYDKSRFYLKKLSKSIQNHGQLNEIDSYFQKAKLSIEHSIDNFNFANRDNAKEDLHNLGTAKIQLASILLRCHGEADEFKVLQPTPHDIKTSKTLLLDQIEDSNIPMDKSMKYYYVRAKCYFYYRTSNRQRWQELRTKLEKLSRKSKRTRWLKEAENCRKMWT